MSTDPDKVAVITDVHGSLPALQAALARIDELGGKPKDGDPRSAFAVLTASAGNVAVSIERVEYNADAVATEVREVGLPGEFANKLLVAA